MAKSKNCLFGCRIGQVVNGLDGYDLCLNGSFTPCVEHDASEYQNITVDAVLHGSIEL